MRELAAKYENLFHFPYSGLPDGVFSNPKIRIWVIFGGSCNGRCWYILWTFGIFFPVLVCCNKKNLATLEIVFSCFNFRYFHITFPLSRSGSPRKLSEANQNTVVVKKQRKFI
jgi:hypothetical protein